MLFLLCVLASAVAYDNEVEVNPATGAVDALPVPTAPWSDLADYSTVYANPAGRLNLPLGSQFPFGVEPRPALASVPAVTGNSTTLPVRARSNASMLVGGSNARSPTSTSL